MRAVRGMPRPYHGQCDLSIIGLIPFSAPFLPPYLVSVRQEPDLQSLTVVVNGITDRSLPQTCDLLFHIRSL